MALAQNLPVQCLESVLIDVDYARSVPASSKNRLSAHRSGFVPICRQAHWNVVVDAGLIAPVVFGVSALIQWHNFRIAVIREEFGSPHWTHLDLLPPKSSVARAPAIPAADDLAYTQTRCSTAAMPSPPSSVESTMDKPCSLTWRAFIPTQPHKPGNEN